jgi:tetratricopeptide (TPR) repeat protein
LFLSVAASAVAMWAQKSQGAMGEEGLWLRLENAAVSCVTYLGEFFWPVKLAVFYPYPDSIAAWRAGMAAGLLVVITLVAMWLVAKRRYLAAGWFWFMVTLLPVIGLVQVGMQAQADRYTYVPYIGLGLMASWGLAELAGIGSRWRVIVVLAAAAGLAGSAAATRVQLKYWQNSETLYKRALAVTSGNYIAHDNLGNLLEDQGKPDQAEKEFEEVIRLTPKIGKPYNDLGKLYALQGKLVQATEMFSNAVRLNPGLAQARWNLGNAWLQKGMVAKGLEEMKAGVALSPDDVEAHRKMADALIKLGKAAEAMPYCEMVVKAEPKDARARFVLGQACLMQKHFDEAMANFKEVLRLAPEAPQALNALAWVYATSSRADIRNGVEAVRLAEKACAITKRQDVGNLDTLAAAYAEAGRYEDAMKAAAEARVLAEAAHDTKTAEMEREREKLYQAGKPYHEEP